MPRFVPKSGPGRLRWELGGWLGGQLGGTAWILVSGCVIMRVDPLAGIALVAMSLACNAVGVALWGMRDRVTPHAGLQILLGVLSAAGAATLVVLHTRWNPEFFEPRMEKFRWWWYLLLLLYPFGSILFWRQNQPPGPVTRPSRVR